MEYETFRFNDYRRHVTDSNHCLTGVEPLVPMGLEPIRDNDGNKIDFSV